MNRIVIKTVLFIPERQTLGAVNIDRVRDVHEVLEKFARHIFVGRVLARQLQCNGQHIQAIHPHPTGAVRLLEMPSGGQRLRTVEYPDVVETQKPALEYVHAIRVLAIYPPREIQQEFMKYAFEEAPVGAPADAVLA